VADQLQIQRAFEQSLGNTQKCEQPIRLNSLKRAISVSVGIFTYAGSRGNYV